MYWCMIVSVCIYIYMIYVFIYIHVYTGVVFMPQSVGQLEDIIRATVTPTTEKSHDSPPIQHRIILSGTLEGMWLASETCFGCHSETDGNSGGFRSKKGSHEICNELVEV